MINLILDCSCGMNVYLVNGDKVFSKTDPTQNKHSDGLLLVIEKLLKESGVKINQIDNFCVCVGPGSFTGVRVAISLVKGLAIGVKSKVFTLTNFDIFDVKSTENSFLVLDGFSTFVYVRKFSNGNIADECIDLNEFKDMVLENNSAVYVLFEKTQKLLNKFEINSNIVNNCIIDAFNDKIKREESVNLNQIFPVYLRASQAEIEREKKLKNGQY